MSSNRANGEAAPNGAVNPQDWSIEKALSVYNIPGWSAGYFGINAKGVYFTIQKALPYLNDGASIIINTSIAGQIGLVNGSVYAATKSALRSFTRSLAAELVARGIRVNAVSPGPIETPAGFERTGLSKEQLDGMLQSILAQVPMKRIGKPSEIASTVAFLASSDASFITGAEIPVDGGLGQV